MDILYSLESEQATLGALLLDNTAIYKIDFINENDFFDLRHKTIFKAINTLIDGNQTADCVTVADALNNTELVAYMAEITFTTPSAANIVRYAQIVKKYSVKRQIAANYSKVIDSVYNRSDMPDFTLNLAENGIQQIVENLGEEKKQSINDIFMGLVDKVVQMKLNPKQTTGLQTGFVDLDRITTGLQSGDLIIIAGRPSMGKTAFAMNVVENAVLSQKITAVFSLEMTAEQLMLRLVSSISGVSLNALKTGKMSDLDYNDKFILGVEKISRHLDYLNINEYTLQTAAGVRRECRRLKNQKGLDLIVIDYLQLMSSDNETDNRNLDLSRITRSLKGLAKELSVPIILLSQLNRDLGKRADKRPILTDLRDSGSIEQDADLVLMLHRPEYYDKENDSLKGLAECIIAKNRNGETGLFNLIFHGEFCRFRSAA